jgi:hypothetical protein
VQVRWFQGKDRPGIISVKTNGQSDQYSSFTGIVFSSKPADAPVLRFGGRFTLRFANDEVPVLSLNQPVELHAEIGTAGCGNNSFVALGAHCVPKDVHPVAEIEYPAKKPGHPAIKSTVVLKGRC